MNKNTMEIKSKNSTKEHCSGLLFQPKNQLVFTGEKTADRFIGGKILIAPKGEILPEDLAEDIFEKHLADVLSLDAKDVYKLPINLDEKTKELSLKRPKGFRRPQILGFIYLEKSEILNRFNVDSITTEAYDGIMTDFSKELRYQNEISCRNP